MSAAANGHDLGGPLLELDDLRIQRARDGGTIVSSVSLAVGAGETIGIVGESGSGKSMTAKAITGLLPPGVVAKGEIRYRGRNLVGQTERQLRSVRGHEIGFVLQDPFTMLNPVMRCGKILRESLRQDRRLSKDEWRAEARRRLAEVGIHDENVIDRYPFQLSGGMRQRVAIAAALARDPQLLIADEPSTALDVATQREVLALIKGVQEARGMSLILITHDLRVAFATCKRIYVLYAGSLVEVGDADDVAAEPFHPYTQGLLLSEPPADQRLRELIAIPGSVPTPDEVATSCTFAPRCRWAAQACVEGSPPLREVGARRLSACIRLEEIRPEMATLRGLAQLEADPVAAARSENPLVVVRDAQKIFTSGGGKVAALDGVSIEVGANESVGIVGESGSGKTTLARILVGLEKASDGTITIGDVPAHDYSKLGRKDRQKLRSTVQIVFQDPYSSLNPMLSIGSTLQEAVTTHDRRARNVDARVADLLESVGLPASYAKRRPVALSGGERQRVAIARALAVNPQLLICDEPVSSLDMSVQAQILNLLAALRAERGMSYLFITHDLAIVRQISDFIYVMHRGKVVESGPVEDVLDRPQHEYTVSLLEAVPRSDGDWLVAAET
ncbi:MAG TPA: ABC transporter ATP-binding protein [Gaiellaceae bacterium]|nr:ABC transporter ATP-binding protein [Gaiellaceae bacterium]